MVENHGGGKGGHSDFSVGAASEADWVKRIGVTHLTGTEKGSGVFY